MTAGLDSGRFGWSGSVPLQVTCSGVAFMLACQVLFALAKRENEFFSSTAAIKSVRGRRVCETGPYRFVRHPGYLGMLISQLAFPLGAFVLGRSSRCPLGLFCWSFARCWKTASSWSSWPATRSTPRRPDGD